MSNSISYTLSGLIFAGIYFRGINFRVDLFSRFCDFEYFAGIYFRGSNIFAISRTAKLPNLNFRCLPNRQNCRVQRGRHTPFQIYPLPTHLHPNPWIFTMITMGKGHLKYIFILFFAVFKFTKISRGLIFAVDHFLKISRGFIFAVRSKTAKINSRENYSPRK